MKVIVAVVYIGRRLVFDELLVVGVCSTFQHVLVPDDTWMEWSEWMNHPAFGRWCFVGLKLRKIDQNAKLVLIGSLFTDGWRTYVNSCCLLVELWHDVRAWEGFPVFLRVSFGFGSAFPTDWFFIFSTVVCTYVLYRSFLTRRLLTRFFSREHKEAEHGWWPRSLDANQCYKRRRLA